jgi:maleate isomerase
VTGPLRIGLIVPSSNTVVEPVLHALTAGLPRIEIFVTRIEVTRIGADPGSEAQFTVDRMVSAGRLLGQAGVDVLVWAGTSGSWLGIGHDRAVVTALQEATGTPATTATLALLDACRAFGGDQVHLVTPYREEIAAGIVASYAEAGIEVTGGHHLGMTDNHAFAAIGPQDLQAGLRSARGTGARAVLVVCTNLRALPLVEGAEADLGLPVLDSVAACLTAAAWTAGASLALEGSGTLLATGVRRATLQAICERLLAETGAQRTTIRLTDPGLGVDVAMPVAEAASPGIRSIRWDPTLDQRALETVRWVDAQRELLVQPDFGRPPFPPDALQEVYGVRAQMLAPLPDAPAGKGPLRGWISAHSTGERPWPAQDQQAMQRAVDATARCLDGELSQR